ncbi:MAG: nuclear transport factor 2 family protein [Bacteroidota bacterium]
MRPNLVIPLFLFYLAVAQSQSTQVPRHLKSLITTERQFAATCQKTSIRESFLQYFADSGIVFRPHPVVFKEWSKQNPIPSPRPKVKLEWEPMFGEVSAAGDLGYDVGPSRFTDQTMKKKQVSYGFFSSVWKKQSDGTWKVALDLGIQAPKEAASYFGKPLQKSAFPTLNFKLETRNFPGILLALDSSFSRLSVNQSPVEAYNSYLSTESRMHRNGAMPVVGKTSVKSYVSKTVDSLSIEPMSGDIASSGDLGYTYGRYVQMAPEIHNSTIEKGYYVHVWRKGADGNWKIVFDVTAPVADTR